MPLQLLIARCNNNYNNYNYIYYSNNNNNTYAAFNAKIKCAKNSSHLPQQTTIKYTNSLTLAFSTTKTTTTKSHLI